MLSINGRFLTQRITGVQRCAHEMLHALDGLLEAHAGKNALEAELLVPPEVLEENLPSLRNIAIRQLGRLHGHAWEQVELPRLAQGLLLNFCNTFPMVIRRQIVVIHDASIYASPEGYTPAFKAYYRVMFATARYRNNMRIVTVSEFSKVELQKFAGFKASQMSVIHNGADHWKQVAPDFAVLARLGLVDRPFLMAVGSENKNKNIGRLIEAFHKLSSPIPLVLAGGKNTQVFSNTEVLRGENLIRTGYLTDAELAALYSRALAFVFPSLYEGFGLPPLEAMYFGCPVISSRAASLPEVAGDAALYCNAHDVDDIAACLQKIIADKAMRDRLIQAGDEQVARFTWRASAEKMLALAQSWQR